MQPLTPAEAFDQWLGPWYVVGGVAGAFLLVLLGIAFGIAVATMQRRSAVAGRPGESPPRDGASSSVK